MLFNIENTKYCLQLICNKKEAKLTCKMMMMILLEMVHNDNYIH